MIKQRSFWLVIVITIGCMLLSAAWIDNTKLKQTVFIPQYSDILLGNQSFSIFYVEDRNTKQPLQHIQIEGLSGLYQIYGPEVKYQLGRNQLKYITFNPINNNMDYTHLENQILTEATAFYSNGVEKPFIFGELRLHSNEGQQPILHPLTSGSSSNGDHLIIAKTSANIEITKLYFSFPEITNHHLTANITTTDHYILEPNDSFTLVTGDTYPLDDLSLPLTFESGQFIRMEFQQQDDLFINYDAEVIVHGMNLDTGEEFHSRIGMIMYQLQSNHNQVDKFIKKVRES